MATPLKVLIDINVVLDAIGKREPFREASTRVMASAETGLIEGYIAAHSITTFYYLTARFYSRAVAHSSLTDLLQFLSVATVDAQVIERALALPYKDFEDAVQMMAGIHAGVEYIVTRNLSDFKSGPLPARSPVELLALIYGQES